MPHFQAVSRQIAPRRPSGCPASNLADSTTVRGDGLRCQSIEPSRRQSTPRRHPYAPPCARKVYIISPNAFSMQKLVKFADQPDFFERHIYQWSR